MARNQTNKIHVSGEQYLGRNLESATVLGDADSSKASHLSRHRAGLAVGVPVIVGAVALGAFLLSWMRPAPNRSISEMVVTRSGGTYVVYNGKAHSYTNLASARLIVGKSDPPSIISDEALNDLPRGQLMGIAHAPNNLTARTDRTVQWVVCDWRDYTADLSLVSGTPYKTTLIAGTDMLDGGHPLADERAVLAKASGDEQTLWLVYRNRKAQVGMRDFATWQALNITQDQVDHAPMFSAGLMNSITTAPILSAPLVAKRGEASHAVPHALNGDILITPRPDGDSDYYVAFDDGVQRVPPLIADLLSNTGSGRTRVPDPGQVATLPQVYHVDVEQYPPVLPDIITPITMCSVWSKETGQLSAETRVITSEALPIRPEDAEKMVPLVPPVGTAAQADGALTRPGSGWYVRVTGDSKASQAAEQIFFITDDGIAYPIGPDGTDEQASNGINYDSAVKALGLDTQLPLPIPWSVASLYARGATLRAADAQVEHGRMAPDTQQVPLPEDKNLNQGAEG